MARNDRTIENVDTDAAENVAPEVTETTEPKAKPVKKGKLPEGYGSPSDFANYVYATPELHSLHQDKDGNNIPVFPGVVFGAKKAADESDPFPTEIVTDSNGIEREAHNFDQVVAWWIRKNERKAAARAEGKSGASGGSIDAQIATAEKRIAAWTEKLAALQNAKAQGLTSLPKADAEVEVATEPVAMETGAE